MTRRTSFPFILVPVSKNDFEVTKPICAERTSLDLLSVGWYDLHTMPLVGMQANLPTCVTKGPYDANFAKRLPEGRAER